MKSQLEVQNQTTEKLKMEKKTHRCKKPSKDAETQTDTPTPPRIRIPVFRDPSPIKSPIICKTDEEKNIMMKTQKFLSSKLFK